MADVNANSNGSLVRLPLGRLGKPWQWVRRQTEHFRRALETAVQERHGTVSLYHAKVIRTGTLALRSAMVVSRVLADAGPPGKEDGISHEVWLAYADRQLRFEQVADKAMKELGIDRAPDPWDAYYRNPPTVAPASPPVAAGGVNGQAAVPDVAAEQKTGV